MKIRMWFAIVNQLKQKSHDSSQTYKWWCPLRLKPRQAVLQRQKTIQPQKASEKVSRVNSSTFPRQEELGKTQTQREIPSGKKSWLRT